MSAPGAEPYQVVARRFRPKTFDELVGQDAVVRSLRDALAAGRVPHAFLFSGSRGVGKTTSARILARALNCAEGVGPDPCGVCEPCRTVLAGTNPDVVEIDAASHNLVDDIRELRERVGFASMGSRYKVYILDEVHMLTRSAFNAFLKTLEEPPANVVFVLATTELHKVPETIRSRCQVLLFRRVDESDVVTRLRAICEHESVALADEVLDEIAASCRGGMRDAETALERVLPVARANGGRLDLETYRELVHRVGFDRTVEVVEELLQGRAAPGMRFADAVVAAGVDEREALGELLDVLRAILLLKVDGEASGLVPHRGALRAKLVALAESTTVERLDAMIQAGLVGRERVRRHDDRRLVLELTMLRIAQAGALATLGDLVAAFESGVASAPPATSGGAGARAAAAPSGAGELRAAVIAALQNRKPMLVATVEACDVRGPDANDRVLFQLRSERRMHKDRLESPQVQDLLREVLEAELGRRVQIVVRAPGEESVSSEAPTGRGAERQPGARGEARRRSVRRQDRGRRGGRRGRVMCAPGRRVAGPRGRSVIVRGAFQARIGPLPSVADGFPGVTRSLTI